MAPKRVLSPDVAPCKAKCVNRNLLNVKVSKENVCTEDLKVATVINQIAKCDKCSEEFSYPISAKEN